MTLSPSAATIVGALIALVSAVLVTGATQWIQHRQKRQEAQAAHSERLWQHRAEVYEDVLVMVADLTKRRSAWVQAGVEAEVPSLTLEPAAEQRLLAKLILFGSPQSYNLATELLAMNRTFTHEFHRLQLANSAVAKATSQRPT